jgi:SNF2 family DNA or RNA helicase
MGHLLHSLQIDNHLRLDGSTAVSERQDMLDKFNNNPSIPVFLLSTRAGGMGKRIVMFDLFVSSASLPLA